MLVHLQKEWFQLSEQSSSKADVCLTIKARQDTYLQSCGLEVFRASTFDPRAAPCGENCLEDSFFEDSHPKPSCPTTLSYLKTSENSNSPGIFGIQQQQAKAQLSPSILPCILYRGLRSFARLQLTNQLLTFQ